MSTRCRFTDFADSAWVTAYHEATVGALGMTGVELSRFDDSPEGRDGLERCLRLRYFAEPLEITVRAKLHMYMGEARPIVTCIAAAPVDKSARGRELLAEIRGMLASGTSGVSRSC